VPELITPIIFAVALWWASTGAILYLDGLGRRTFPFSMAAMSALALGALAAVWLTAASTTVLSAYVAFTAALVLWGWNEMAFLMGYATGTRREACPPDARGIRRLRYAAETLAVHELAILLTAALIAAVSHGGANRFALWTFMGLWAMRLSTKLNIFLGAPNIPDAFLPPHLAYLKSYFRRRPMNGFFPFAITCATLLTAFLAHMGVAPGAAAFERTGYLLLTALMALAVLEHWLLYVPFNPATLWGWGLKSHARTAAAEEVSARPHWTTQGGPGQRRRP
jgi:putative photosynthetic complex assembly protein 2